jgi:hypothetical protein
MATGSRPSPQPRPNIDQIKKVQADRSKVLAAALKKKEMAGVAARSKAKYGKAPSKAAVLKTYNKWHAPKPKPPKPPMTKPPEGTGPITDVGTVGAVSTMPLPPASGTPGGGSGFAPGGSVLGSPGHFQTDPPIRGGKPGAIPVWEPRVGPGGKPGAIPVWKPRVGPGGGVLGSPGHFQTDRPIREGTTRSSRQGNRGSTRLPKPRSGYFG